MELTSQRVVVIGGSSGIGLAVAREASRLGAEVVIASRRQSSIDAALKTLPGTTGYVIRDVADQQELDELFRKIGRFDHLVYTAAEPLTLMPIGDLDIGDAQAFFQTRYFGALNAARAAAAWIQPSGSITFTSGATGERPGAGWAVATSICGAVEGLGRALAVELAPVRVNTVSPGVLRSPMWDGMDAADRQGMYDSVADSALVGRVGEVEDVALAFVYAMVQGNATGTVIPVSGGALLV